MLIFFSLVLLAGGMSILIMLMGAIFMKKNNFDMEKLSPFECGFTPKFNARMPFSLRFFLISIIFIVFDVELILIFPFLPSMGKGEPLVIMMMMWLFLFILFLGLYHEWNQGSLDWTL